MARMNFLFLVRLFSRDNPMFCNCSIASLTKLSLWMATPIKSSLFSSAKIFTMLVFPGSFSCGQLALKTLLRHGLQAMERRTRRETVPRNGKILTAVKDLATQCLVFSDTDDVECEVDVAVVLIQVPPTFACTIAPVQQNSC